MTKVRYERDIAAARHDELSVSIHLIFEACIKRKDKAHDCLAKLGKVYDKALKVWVDAHVAE